MRASLMRVLIEVGREAASLQAAGQQGVLQLDLDFDRGDAFGSVAEQDHLVDGAELAAIQDKRHEGQGNRDWTTPLHYSTHPADSLPPKTDPDHSDRED